MPIDPSLEAHFTDELKADPVVKDYYDKTDYKNVPDILKGFAHAQHRLGSVVPLPNGEIKPEEIAKWKTEHLPKLVNAKLVDAPRQVPEKYEIAKPEGIPEGGWNDALEQKAHGWAKKHGLSQEAFSEAMGLYHESFGGALEAFQVNRQAQAAKVKEWADSEGISLEQVDAALDRFNKDPRGWDAETAEAVSKSGWADNPLTVKAIYKLMTDSGTFDTRNDGGAANSGAAQEAETAYNEARDIKFKNDHPQHAAYMAEAGRGPLNDMIDNAYKKRFGSKEE